MRGFMKIAKAIPSKYAPRQGIRLPARRHSAPRHFPGLERLEDRITPSVTSVFELDGDVTTGTAHDWDQVFADANGISPSPSGAIVSAFVTDAVDSKDDDIFTGGASMDVRGIQQGPWSFTNARPQAKADIAHAYAAIYIDPSNGHQILYAGLDRFDNSGNAAAGFWFLNDSIVKSPSVSGNGTGPFIGSHSDGDLLLVSNFSTGGSAAINAFVWVGDDATGHLQALPAIPGSAFATVNDGPISVPWSYTNKSGESRPARGEFLEAGVDLTALGLNGCFASFLAETHSSQSPTATLSDFVIGSFETCSLTAPQFTGLSKVGDSVTYPLTVQNTGAMPLFIQSVQDTLLGDIVVNHVLRQPGNPGVNPFVTSIVTSFDFSQPLAPGANLTILVSRTVQAGDPDPTVSTVTVTGTDDLAGLEDPITASVTNSVNLFQPSASMTVTANPTSATSLGQVITYTYTVNNAGSADSPNLVLDTSNPNNSFTAFFNTSPPQVFSLEAAAIAAGGGSLASGASFTFTSTRAIQAGDPTPLTNTATVVFTLAQDLGTFPNQITAQASASVTLLPQLQIDKTITGGVDVIHPADTASFTITVSNTGAGPATNVLVTDQLPAAALLTWSVASSTFGTTSISTGDFLTATSSTLPAGATATITVSAVIPSDIFGSLPGGGVGGLPSGPLELDGNALDDSPRGDDWSNAAFGNGGSAFAHSFVTDTFNSASDDVFTGGGSKDTQGIQQGPWLFTHEKPQGKNDIIHAYAAIYTDPSNGHEILYAGLDRFDNSGEATVGFWFFQNPVGLGTSDPTSSGSPFTGTHADGDILLVSDFTVGGSTSTSHVFRWTGDDSSGSLIPVTTSPGATYAIVNGALIDVPWPFADKSLNSDPAAGEFLEGGVDLTALGLGGCFSSFLAETRSSQSPTATLSDFVIGSFNTCRVDLANTATVQADGIAPMTSNEVVITLLDAQDLLQAESIGAGAGAESLTAAELQPALAQARDAWRAAGVDPQQLSMLERVTVRLGNLPRAELGVALPGEIWIDRTAAGWGWSTGPGATGGRMDLVSVVTHELGHVLGFEHSATGVMQAILTAGHPRVPQALDGVSAGASAGLPPAVSVGQIAVAPPMPARTVVIAAALVGVRDGVTLPAFSATTAVDAVFAAAPDLTPPAAAPSVPVNRTAPPSEAPAVTSSTALTAGMLRDSAAAAPGAWPPSPGTRGGEGPGPNEDGAEDEAEAPMADPAKVLLQRINATCFADSSGPADGTANAAPAPDAAVAVALTLALGSWCGTRPVETQPRKRQRFPFGSI